MNYDVQSMGEIIALKRKEMGLTQDALADILGVTAQAVSKWERGGGLPDITILPDLSTTLGLSMEELFGRHAEDEMVVRSFPEEYEGLRKVHEVGSVACYSNLPVEKTVGVLAYFNDGSTANLGNGEIKFRSAEDIKLLYANELNRETDDVISSVIEDESVPSDSAALDDLDGVNSIKITSVGSINYVISESPTGKMRWGAKNLAEIKEHLDVYREGNTLVFNYKAPSSFGLFNMFAAGHRSDETIRIEMPMKLASRLEYSIAGSGDLESLIDFEEMDLAISGSGDIKVARAGVVDIRISGSGDFSCLELHDAQCKTSGAGDITIEEAKGELSIGVSGAGDVEVKKGDLSSLVLSISGAGDFDGAGVTTNYADIVLSGACDAVIGHIKGESRERVSQVANLKVLKRG